MGSTLFKEVALLVKKEAVLEWRQKYAINGILLYLVSTIFVCYLSFNVRTNQLGPVTWNVIFWIIILFSAVNAVAKSFVQEQEGRQLYYYTIASPEAMILSKTIYNMVLLIVLAVGGFFIYSIVLGNPVQDKLLFLVDIALAAIGFSAVLTMVSGIASKANNNGALMAILSFPILLPMLLMVIKVSKNAIDGLDRSSSYDELVILMAINVMVGAVGYVLFPYLWRS